MRFDFNFQATTIILLSALLLVTIYVTTLVRARIALPAKIANLQDEEPDRDDPQPVSVVVYARDNSARLELLLDDLLKQQYSAPFEIIVVNDSGGYTCSDVVTRLSIKHSNLRMTFVPEQAHNLSRKKLAVTLGLKAARYPYVLLLNAECRLASNRWLATMARDTEKVTLGTACITPDEGTPDLTPIQRLDASNTTIIWIVAAALKHPFRGTGYNLGYPSATFFAKDGFAGSLNLKAGDDDLFINKITTPANTRVELSSSSRVAVTTSHARQLYRELKISHLFTGRHLPSHPVIETLPLVLWASIVLAVAATLLAWPNMSVPVASVILLLLQWILTARAWHTTAAVLGYPVSYLAVIPLLLRLPLHNLRNRLIARSNKSQHYTWQKQKKI